MDNIQYRLSASRGCASLDLVVAPALGADVVECPSSLGDSIRGRMMDQGVSLPGKRWKEKDATSKNIMATYNKIIKTNKLPIPWNNLSNTVAYNIDSGPITYMFIE